MQKIFLSAHIFGILDTGSSAGQYTKEHSTVRLQRLWDKASNDNCSSSPSHWFGQVSKPNSHEQFVKVCAGYHNQCSFVAIFSIWTFSGYLAQKNSKNFKPLIFSPQTQNFLNSLLQYIFFSQESTKHTPFEAMFGRRGRLPVDFNADKNCNAAVKLGDFLDAESGDSFEGTTERRWMEKDIKDNISNDFPMIQ